MFKITTVKEGIYWTKNKTTQQSHEMNKARTMLHPMGHSYKERNDFISVVCQWRNWKVSIRSPG